jgi:glycosyltransferase involved in cell wall biosynthesis
MQTTYYKLTVVTVTYNAGASLEKTIQSVINQEYPNLEYIIIDGSSTDETIEIIKKYEKNINYWISEPDKGIYEAMNKGIEVAKGDWINFMNAGDAYANNETLAKLSQQIRTESDIVYGDRFYLKKDKKTLQKAMPIETIFKRMPFGHQATFFKRDLIQNIRFNDTYKFAADYNLLMQLYLQNYNFQYVELPICNYVSGGKSESGLRPYLEVLKILFDNCDDEKVIEQNVYFQSFYKNSKNLLKKSIGR